MSRVVAFLLVFAVVSLRAERINQEGRILGPQLAVTNSLVFNTTNADAVLGTLQITPTDSPWSEDVSMRPLSVNSTAIIDLIYRQATNAKSPALVRPDFGLNFALIPNNQTNAPITFGLFADESDPGPYPFPTNTPVSAWPLVNSETLDQYQRDPSAGGDRTAIVFQPGTGFLWETYNTLLTTNWQADLGAKFNLNTNATQRPIGWSSASQSGMPYLPGVVRFDELQRGVIEHALHIVVTKVRDNSATYGPGYVYPASAPGFTPATNAYMPRYGERLRLKSSFVTPPGWTVAEQAVVQALKKYGAIVVDQGLAGYFSLASDDRCAGLFPNMSVTTSPLSITNLEVVEPTGLTEGPRSPGAPVVDVGPDLRVRTNVSVQLQASITYSNPKALALNWLKYSGPGPVVFADSKQAFTTATFSVPGIYTIEFSAQDFFHSPAYDALVVTVVPDSRVAIAKSGTNAVVSWTGGVAPYTLEQATNVGGSWAGIVTTNGTNVTLPMTNGAGFFRVRD